jgi:16S rRNA (cytidine1402-2'-O)-methyltransferase
MVLKLSQKQVHRSQKRNEEDPNAKYSAGLYLVATPIGNLKDISFRAIETLQNADLILCEDTRVSATLLKAYDIKKPLLSLHDHNEEQRAEKIIDLIKNQNQIVALISDAGMPLISDPGYKLVSACRSADLYVTSIPGASSVLMALQVSGLPSDQFVFLGFAPTKSKARRDLLTEWMNCPATLILFENGLRVKDLASDIDFVFKHRPMALARELTKLFEDVWNGTAKEFMDHIDQNGAPKGEVVILIGGHKQSEIVNDFNEIDDLLIKTLKANSLKDAVSIVTEMTGRSKKEIYKRALELDEENS